MWGFLRVATGVVACVLVCLCVPSVASAAVLINEVAWMGTTLSANDEWIELRNTGTSPVSLDGWTLADSSGSLNIELSGTLVAGAYGVLERTDDDSAPGTALLIYTGALLNSGVTLTLRRADSGIEDQVAGGEDWVEIGGDNATKETAQLTSGGWITATATPGAVNTESGGGGGEEEEVQDSEDETEAEEDSPASTEVESDNDRVGRIRIFADDPLKLSLTHLARGFVGQPVRFTATPSGLEQTKLRTLSYRWSFGDGATSKERTPLHTYERAGTYVVVAVVSRAGHEAAARSTITVLPLSVSLSRTERGDLLLHNDAKYEIDASGLVLSDGTTSFALPEHTYIPTRGTLMLASGMTGFSARPQYAVTLSPRGEVLARYPAPEEPETLAIVDVPQVLAQGEAGGVPISVSEGGAGEAFEPPGSPATLPSESLAAISEVREEDRRSRYAMAAFAALMALSVLALYVHRFV